MNNNIFYHSGAFGDIIYSIPFCLSCVGIYNSQQLEKNKYTLLLDLCCCHKPNGDYDIAYQNLKKVAQLMNIQPYIQQVICQKQISWGDYGCGKATLSKHIIASKPNVQFYNYDFAIQEYNKFPQNKNFDLCTCIDVLQHVTENQLHLVFKQILSVSNNYFFNISCRTAYNKLPNGQNCHCTVHNQQWWLQFLKKYFYNIIKIDSESNELTCFAGKKIDGRG